MAMIPPQAESTSSDPAELQSALASQDEPGVYIESKKSKFSAGTLFLAALFVAGIGATYVMYLKAGPKAALATTAESKAASATISQFLSEGKKDIANMQTMLADTEKVVQKFLQYPSHTQVPGSELQTNPFLFEKATPNEPNEERQDSAAALMKKRDEARAAARTEASKLKLTSVLVGTSENIAFISGKQIRLGDDVEGFKVESIASDSVVIARDGFRFKLTMSR